jgi:excisionase family DNA binding protein
MGTWPVPSVHNRSNRGTLTFIPVGYTSPRILNVGMSGKCTRCVTICHMKTPPSMPSSPASRRREITSLAFFPPPSGSEAIPGGLPCSYPKMGYYFDMNSMPEVLRTNRKPLRVSELAERLNVSEGALYTMTKRDRIPFFRVGGAIRFDPILIANWLEGKWEFDALEGGTNGRRKRRPFPKAR